MSWPEIYVKIFDELWEQIKKYNDISDDEKPILPPLPNKVNKFPPEDRRWVQAFVTFITINYKIDLLEDDTSEPQQTDEIKKPGDTSILRKPSAFDDKVPPPPDLQNLEIPPEDDEVVPVLKAGFMSPDFDMNEQINSAVFGEMTNSDIPPAPTLEQFEEPLSDSFEPTQKLKDKKPVKKKIDYPNPPEYRTDLEWETMSKQLVMLLTEDMPEFIKNTLIKDFLTKRQSKLKDSPQQLFKDPTFIGSLVQLASSIGEMGEIIPPMKTILDEIYEFLGKLPGAYIPEEEDLEEFPKLFKIKKAASIMGKGSVIKFINPAYFMPKSKRPRIQPEVIVTDYSTSEAESFVRNNTELLRSILLQYLPNLPDIYTLTLDRLSKSFSKTSELDMSKDDLINVVNVLTELNYFFAGIEQEQLFIGIMKFTDCLSEMLLNYNVNVFPRIGMSLNEENVDLFGEVVVARVPDTKPENTVLRIKRRGIKVEDETIKNAVIVVSAGDTMKELSKSFSMATQLMRSPAFYSSGKRGAFFENVSKFDEYLLKFIQNREHDSKSAGFLRDLINHLDEINHPTGAALSKPLSTVTSGISNYLQRRYSIEEFPVMVGSKYDRSYLVKNYSVQRVKRSGKQMDTILGVRQRGFAKNDGTFLQNCILWVAE
ncbi:MAG: hypothetical protein K8S87_05135 [Planctomycetes bacterium]|nr:hypothetical protein [Planctomycetota bacterium]